MILQYVGVKEFELNMVKAGSKLKCINVSPFTVLVICSYMLDNLIKARAQNCYRTGTDIRGICIHVTTGNTKYMYLYRANKEHLSASYSTMHAVTYVYYNMHALIS